MTGTNDAGANSAYMPISSSFFTLRNPKLWALMPSRLRHASERRRREM